MCILNILSIFVFIEVKFMQYKINHSKAKNSMTFSTFTMFYNYNVYFYHSKKTLLYLLSS